jgi:hypothetical protein
VHANVGGGYPDDGLAYVALDWMMDEAAACGLRSIPHLRSEIRWRADPHGEQYDSRAGVAGYYRYGPRDVALLCDDDQHKVKVPTPRVHVGAFDRIARHQRAYAPVSLNTRFELMGANPAQLPPSSFLTAELDQLEHAWDIVWWRRLAYFATLGMTAFVGLFFAALVFAWPDRILDCVDGALKALVGAYIADAVAWALQKGSSLLAAAMPGWLAAVLPSFSKHPLTAIVSLALLAALFFRVSDKLQGRIGAYAEWAWGGQKGLPVAGAPDPNWLNAIARPGRKITGFLYRAVWRPVVVHLAGFVIGVAMFIPIVLIWIARSFRRKPWMA